MSVPGEEERLVRVHDVIQQLPPCMAILPGDKSYHPAAAEKKMQRRKSFMMLPGNPL